MVPPMRLLMLAVTAIGLSACCCQSREEKLKASEDEGNLLIATKARLRKGAGEAVKKEGKEAAETMAANGLGLTRAARGENGTAAHTITAYVTFEKGFERTPLMTAGRFDLRAVPKTP